MNRTGVLSLDDLLLFGGYVYSNYFDAVLYIEYAAIWERIDTLLSKGKKLYCLPFPLCIFFLVAAVLSASPFSVETRGEGGGRKPRQAA